MQQANPITLYLDSARESDTICLGFAQMNKEDLEQVASFVGDNPFVRYLDLRGNNIGAESTPALATAIKQNRSLVSLKLMHNAIGEDVAGLQALCTVLQPNLSITHLDLCDNKIDEAGAKIIGEMLAANTAITHIDLTRNNLGVAGGVSLVNNIRHCRQLVDLQISGSNCGTELLYEVAFFLRQNLKKIARREQEKVEEAEAAEPSKKAKAKAKADEPQAKAKAKAGGEEEKVAVLPQRQWRYEDQCELQRRLQKKQRDQKVPGERAIFKEISSFMDKTLVETKRHKTKFASGRQRESLAASSFKQRELRYTREISQIEHALIDNLGSREGIVQQNKWRSDEVERIKGEARMEEDKSKLQQERAKLEQQKLREQIKEMQAMHRELRDRLNLLNEDLRAQSSENDRLREHVKSFKRNVAEVIG